MVVIGLGSAGVGVANSMSESWRKIVISASDFPKKCSSEEEYEEYAKGGRKYDIEWNKYLNTEESKESRREIWEDELEIRREFLERMKAVQQNLERIQDRLHPNNEYNPDSEPFFVCKSSLFRDAKVDPLSLIA